MVLPSIGGGISSSAGGALPSGWKISAASLMRARIQPQSVDESLTSTRESRRAICSSEGSRGRGDSD
eukprot:2073067-Prymnesium_polylepis.1